jgi:hypothetical protein
MMKGLRRYLTPVLAVAFALMIAGCSEDETVKSGFGNLRFDVRPQGASFFFDGNPVAAEDANVEIVTEYDAANGRLRFDRPQDVQEILENHDLIFMDEVPSGRHEIRVEAAGFLTRTLPIIVRADEIKGIPVELQGLVTVTVRSSPDQARLFLNGILQTLTDRSGQLVDAVTPVTLGDGLVVPEERYTFKLTKDGFFTTERIDTVRVDKSRFSFDLLPLPVLKPLRFGTKAKADEKPPSLPDNLKAAMEADGVKVGKRNAKRADGSKIVFGVKSLDNENDLFSAFQFLRDERLGGEFDHIAVIAEFEGPVQRFFQPAIRLVWNNRLLPNKTFFPQVGKWDFLIVYDNNDFRNAIQVMHSNDLGTNLQAGQYRVEVVWDRRILQKSEFEIR